MGGGAAMRAAARAAGIGVVAGGLRGVPGVSVGESTISAAVGKTSRPVSPTLSASTVHSDALSAQRLSWETDDWEFAGGEEEWVVGSADPLPRLVFGGAPSLQEAREATSELKEALETVYLSSPDSFAVEESKACVTSDTSVTTIAPNHAIEAFKLLKENPAAQTVVASIASDQNVWKAVMQNEALVEFIKSQKTDLDVGTVGYEEFKYQQMPSGIKIEEVDGSPGKTVGDYLMNMKLKVMEMVSNLSDYIQNLFGGTHRDEKGSGQESIMDKAAAASPFMALAVLVITVIVLKRA